MLFDLLKRRSKGWEIAGKCGYKGCGKTSVPRSHSIHRAGSLERIAEQQHVLMPATDDRGSLTLKRVGVNVASTFPGFCSEHEQLFQEFERTGEITEDRHVALQAFRTLCREIIRKRHDVEGGQRALEAYRKVRHNYFEKAILEVAPDVVIEGTTVEGQGPEEHATSVLMGARADLAELSGELYDELFGYIAGQGAEPCVQALKIPLEVPVSLSGLGVLRYKDATGTHRALCLLGIMPQEKATVMFMCAVPRHQAAIKLYTAKMVSGFGALNTMESWMVYGSDHWFIRPSAWEALPPGRRSAILEMVMSPDYNIGSEVPLSVLDGPRRTIIDYVNAHLQETVVRHER